METENWNGEIFNSSDDENSRDEVLQVLFKLESKEYLHSEDGQDLLKDLKHFCDHTLCECVEGDESCLPREYSSVEISEKSLKSEKDECDNDICSCKDKEECPHKMKKYRKLFKQREKCTCEDGNCSCVNKDKCPHNTEESREHKDKIRVTDVDYLTISVEVKQTTHTIEKDTDAQNKSSLNETEKENLRKETYNIKVVVDEGHIREIVQNGEETNSGVDDEHVLEIIQHTEMTTDPDTRKPDKIKSTLISKEKTITLTESFKTSNPNDFIKIENKTEMEFQAECLNSTLQESHCEDGSSLKSIESSKIDDFEKLDSGESRSFLPAEKENLYESYQSLIDESQSSIDESQSTIIQIEEKPFTKEFIKRPQPKKKCSDVCSSFISISEADNSEISLNTLEKFIFDEVSTEVLFALEEESQNEINSDLNKEKNIKEIIDKSDSSSNIGDMDICEDAESYYAPRENEDKVENAKYREIKQFAEILLDETFKNAQEVVEQKKALFSQRLLSILSEKQEAKKEFLSLDDEEEKEMEKKIQSLTNSSFNIILGYKFIENLIEQWKRIEEWRHCTKLIDKYSDHSTDFYIYEVIWSLPTERNPVPIATASIFFEFRVSHIKPQSYPVEVQYNFEFSRFTHYPGKTKFQEKWLYDILRAKEKMYDALRY